MSDGTAGALGPIESIPAVKISYANRLLVEIADRGPVTLDVLFRQLDPEELFKSSKVHVAAPQRARQLALFARRLGLLEESPGGLELTPTGEQYVDAIASDDIWSVTEPQASLLRNALLAHGRDDGMLRATALMLSVVASVPAGLHPSREELGRAMAWIAGVRSWKSPKTFESQAERFLGLLAEMGLLQDEATLSDEGHDVLRRLALPDHPGFEAALASEASEEGDDDELASLIAAVLGTYNATQREGGEELEALYTAIGDVAEVTSRVHLRVKRSMGRPAWPFVAWVAFLDERETRSVRRGVYPVLLFRADLTGVYLAFLQGVAELVEDLGRDEAFDTVRQRAEQLRTALPAIQRAGFETDEPLELYSPDRRLGPGYEASDIGHRFYPADDLPAEGQLRSDLRSVLEIYDDFLAMNASNDPARSAWRIQPGRGGKYDALAVEHECVIVGWSEFDNLDELVEQGELRSALERAYPDRPAGKDEGDLRRFIEIAIGDVVVMPRADKSGAAVGIVTGPYRHRTEDEFENDARNTRDVEWVSPNVPYDAFDGDLRIKGVRVTVGRIDAPDAAARILAAAQKPRVMHLVLKWKANPADTPERHRAIAASAGSVWWGSFTKEPGTQLVSDQRIERFRAQLEAGEETVVFMDSEAGGTWRARLEDVTANEAEVDMDLVPDYYPEDANVGVWVRLAELQPTNRSEIKKGYVLDRDGKPVTDGALRNQTPMFVRAVEHVEGPEPAVGSAFLSVDALREASEAKGLRIEDPIYASLAAAINAGKHVVLTGPPGTAKTTLAIAAATAAVESGLTDSYLPTTATADWTTYETIGGLRPKEGGRLVFEPGHFLQAIGDDHWLIIDELNRSNFDRAFGQLFTVLSGQAVTLPYRLEETEAAGRTDRLTIYPPDAENPTGDHLQISEGWRVIATMNVFDKSLLFEMSYALMRRFAFIEVPSPPIQVFEELIELHAEGSEGSMTCATSLLAVRGPSTKDIGPAVYMDIASYARERLALGGITQQELALEAFYSYLLPQFEGIDDEQGRELFKRLKPIVGTALLPRLRVSLQSVLGLTDLGALEDDEPDEDDDEAVD